MPCAYTQAQLKLCRQARAIRHGAYCNQSFPTSTRSVLGSQPRGRHKPLVLEFSHYHTCFSPGDRSKQLDRNPKARFFSRQSSESVYLLWTSMRSTRFFCEDLFSGSPDLEIRLEECIQQAAFANFRDDPFTVAKTRIVLSRSGVFVHDSYKQTRTLSTLACLTTSHMS